VAILSFSGTVELDENDSTLPVPFSGSNDWANTGVVITVNIANAVRSFFMFRLLWLRSESRGQRKHSPSGAVANGAATVAIRQGDRKAGRIIPCEYRLAGKDGGISQSA
jgi:hypothetical protein